MRDWFRELNAWHDFYVFFGTAAATLMGLMFVVMSLGQRTLATDEGTRATRSFFTPIVVFFATVIVVGALMLIPHPGRTTHGALLLALAVSGVVYMLASDAHRMWRHSQLGFDDLIWYVVLPYLAFFAIGAGAIGIWKGASFGLYTIAVAMFVLLLTGIRNAWDLVVYNVQHRF